MIRNPKFDDIRPFYDEEIPAAMERIATSDVFPLIASYVYPNEDINAVRKKLLSFTKLTDFQYEVMYNVNRQVIARSISSFTYDGIEKLCPSKPYLFVSNHRDIMLDACLLGYVLYLNKHESPEITFGSNLMSSPLVIDIGKANKMFRVERGGNIKEFYHSCFHCSEYIRYAITEKKQSVWIAQRNGRTKDGNDLTDQGIVKMFGMSYHQDKIKALEELNIVPVSISYEWEPCDILKALELYETRFKKYTKKPGEDLNSILTGITQQKGAVHISFCPQIAKKDLLQFDSCTSNEFNHQVTHLIDRSIRSHYKLSPNNYIAHDLRYAQKRFESEYTLDQKSAFVKRMEELQQFEITDFDLLKDIFLAIYANPVDY